MKSTEVMIHADSKWCSVGYVRIVNIKIVDFFLSFQVVDWFVCALWIRR